MEANPKGSVTYTQKGMIPRFLYHPSAKRILPAWGFVIVLLTIAAIINPRLLMPKNLSEIAMLASLMAVAGLGQGLVVLVGGIDLSIPVVAACSSVVTTWYSLGQNGPLWWIVPLLIAFGIIVGLINGFGSVVLGIHPVIMTLAMFGVLEGGNMLFTMGTPRGTAPPALIWFVTGKVGGVFVSVIVLAIITVIFSLILSRTSYGRKMYAIGSSQTVTTLCGIRSKVYAISAYVVSALCGVLLGWMLTGLIGLSYNGIGAEYLLVSIAVVAIGGADMLGGKGHFLGTLGGAFVLTLISVLLLAVVMPEGVRNIIYGAMILLGIIGVREKRKEGY
jgi:ribose transport system permease protein